MDPKSMALLIAVPVEFEDFNSRVRTSDWLSKFYNPGLSEEEQRAETMSVWNQSYGSMVAQPFLGLIAQAERLGIEVSTKATLGDLEKASQTKEVIVVFAHWKGPEVVADDLRGKLDLETLAKLVASSQELIAQRIRAKMDELKSRSGKGAGYSIARFFGLINAERARGTVDILSETVDESVSEEVRYRGAVVVSKAHVKAKLRDSLDVLLGDRISPGNRLELFDGMQRKEDVERNIAKEFDGVLDLTMCTSSYLADYISGKRQRSLRTVQFPTVQKFDWAVKCAGITLEVAVQTNIPYLEARLFANQFLTTEVKRVAREKQLDR